MGAESGTCLIELRLSVPEAGRRLLPLPVAAWHATVGARTVDGIAKGDAVLVHGQLVRRFYRSGAGARSMTEVVATVIRKLEVPPAAGGPPAVESSVTSSPDGIRRWTGSAATVPASTTTLTQPSLAAAEGLWHRRDDTANHTTSPLC